MDRQSSSRVALSRLALQEGRGERETPPHAPTYMRELCNLLEHNPNQAGFERAVREMVTDGKRRLVEWLKDCEAEVDDALKAVTTPDAMFVGDC